MNLLDCFSVRLDISFFILLLLRKKFILPLLIFLILQGHPSIGDGLDCPGKQLVDCYFAKQRLVETKLWHLQVFWRNVGQQLPGKRSICSSICKLAVALVAAARAALALAADTLLNNVASFGAVIHPNLRGVELWEK